MTKREDAWSKGYKQTQAAYLAQLKREANTGKSEAKQQEKAK